MNCGCIDPNNQKACYAYISDAAWSEKIKSAYQKVSACSLCPRRCGNNRLKGEVGFCRAPGEMIISSIFPHHGEEPSISGVRGSGTVFFSRCTMRCVFCQNHQISQGAEGDPCSVEELAEKMLWLQAMGCHNINLVTPTHFLPWILDSLYKACKAGLTIPVVYNCGGYEAAETLEILDGIVDIYLPDMKYGDDEAARLYSGAEDYVRINQEAIRIMFRQVGPLRTNAQGVAYRGLCIRHLVLPNELAGSELIEHFLQSHFDPQDICISLMAQYRPLHKAKDIPQLARRTSLQEYEKAKELFISAGFGGYYQEADKLDTSFCIDFSTRKNEPLGGDGVK